MTSPPCIVVMAKTPRLGGVKTRLTADDGSGVSSLSDADALRVHTALLACVVTRVGRWVRRGLANGVLALDEPDPFGEPHHATLRRRIDRLGFSITNQGTGDLGQRLDHVWQQLEPGPGRDPDERPVVFFGVDSPDLPDSHIDAALRIAANKDDPHHPDAGVGPVGDGGYWCLAARRYTPALLGGIDWGTAAVYDQTRKAAHDAGHTPADLPAWHDVDTPGDLADLLARLNGSVGDSATDPALRELSDALGDLT